MAACPTYRVPIYGLCLVRERTVSYPVTKVSSPKDAGVLAEALLASKPVEHMLAILVNGQQDITGVHVAGIGSLHALKLEIRDLFRAAIAGNARGIVIAHNHPSGNPNPSPEDISFTKEACSAGQLLGIPIQDHIIVAANDGGRFSFYERGLLQEHT